MTTKVRQDAWSHEDDVFLAETVLEHIRTGSTQLKAFDEVGDRMNRTSAACGFRWNAVVRPRYEAQVAEAKRERKRRKREAAETDTPFVKPKRKEAKVAPVSVERELSLDAIIQYLEELQQSSGGESDASARLEQAEAEREELKTELAELQEKYKQMENDYQMLMSLMNRAQQMMDGGSGEEPTPAQRIWLHGNTDPYESWEESSSS
ncbi:prespore-specific regulator [Salsuginibacillus halophilus]|uniref:Prespore-specific regulator n=1 Tax=Salsuginibacillus halophilus TaxID=517424 RepID=A0A2P8HI05_9BACI|nr:RsfA family transcriptional regulator [Salsuginibacillus halophilus]PSL45841.1 prespore-specific regulator [Salsuginibacillus halophilus]